MDGIAITAVLAGTGAIIALFIKYISSRDTMQEKRDEIFAKALAVNTKAMEAVAKSSQEVALETAKGNREAKERNGHLGEQNIQITQLITGQNKDLAAIRASSQDSADTNVRTVKVLEMNAATLQANTKKVLIATEKVARLLKDTDAVQIVDQQTVVHQLVKNKERK